MILNQSKFYHKPKNGNKKFDSDLNLNLYQRRLLKKASELAQKESEISSKNTKIEDKILELDLLAEDGVIVCECGEHEKITNENVEVLKEREFKKMSLFILGKK